MASALHGHLVAGLGLADRLLRVRHDSPSRAEDRQLRLAHVSTCMRIVERWTLRTVGDGLRSATTQVRHSVPRFGSPFHDRRSLRRRSRH
jgi:hypothetical protein